MKFSFERKKQIYLTLDIRTKITYIVSTCVLYVCKVNFPALSNPILVTHCLIIIMIVSHNLIK